jgi:ABC-type transport system substrate-binding protein
LHACWFAFFFCPRFTHRRLTLDPHGALIARTQMMQGWLYEGLVRFDKDMKCQPALAESYERTAPDTWRFDLRAARFHDGSVLKADDVVFSVERALSQRSSTTTRSISSRTRRTRSSTAS